MTEITINELYEIMLKEMGPQKWWPAERWMETVVGSILIQNASAITVDPVIEEVGRQTNFDPSILQAMPQDELETLIMPAGLYRSKAKYLRAALDFFATANFDLEQFQPIETKVLRKNLRAIAGIGNETADVWLVYIFGRAQFIADSYARRLLMYLGVHEKMNYDQVKKIVMHQSEFTPDEAREFHALIDEFGKMYLRNEAQFKTSWLQDYRVVQK